MSGNRPNKWDIRVPGLLRSFEREEQVLSLWQMGKKREKEEEGKGEVTKKRGERERESGWRREFRHGTKEMTQQKEQMWKEEKEEQEQTEQDQWTWEGKGAKGRC